MGDNSSPPPAPNMTPISDAQLSAANSALGTGNDMLAWARQQYAKNSGNADQFINSALSQDSTLNGNSATDRQTYENVYTPELEAQKNDADNYASAARKEAAMGAAQAGVAQQFEGARQAAQQQLEGYGIDPSSTRMAALDIGTRTQEAAAKAAAGTQASNTVDQQAQALRQQVIANSAPLATQSTNEATAGANIGAAGVNAGNSTTSTGASTMGTNPQYQAIAANDLTGSANTQNQAYANELNQYKAEQASSSGIGSALGTAAGLAMKFIAKGGAVGGDDATPGGQVPNSASPTGGAAVDDVSARLTAGEFVIPKDVTAWIGEKNMQALIQKARMEKQKATAKPAIGHAPPQAPTFQSRPQGAIPAAA